MTEYPLLHRIGKSTADIRSRRRGDESSYAVGSGNVVHGTGWILGHAALIFVPSISFYVGFSLQKLLSSFVRETALVL